MPTLGILRNQMTREILDEDLNIYKQVYAREKEQVKGFADTMTPKQYELNQQIASTLEGDVAKFREILEKTYDYIETHDVSEKNKNMSFLPHIFPLINQYNKIMSQINNPALNKPNRDSLASEMHKTQPYLASLMHVFITKINEKLEFIGDDRSPSGKLKKSVDDIITPSDRSNIIRTVWAYVAIRYMNNNLINNKYTIITEEDINYYFENLMRTEFGGTRIAKILMNVAVDIENPFLKQRIRADESVLGRRLTDEEKQYIARSYNIPERIRNYIPEDAFEDTKKIYSDRAKKMLDTKDIFVQLDQDYRDGNISKDRYDKLKKEYEEQEKKYLRGEGKKKKAKRVKKPHEPILEYNEEENNNPNFIY